MPHAKTTGTDAEMTAVTTNETVAEVTAWLDENPTLRRFVGAARKLDQLWEQEPELFTARDVFVVRNFTIEPIEPLLKVAGYQAGLGLKLSYSGYEPAASLGADGDVRCDVVLLMLRLEQLMPALAADFLDLTADAALEMAAEAVDRVAALANALRGQHRAPILVHNFVTPLAPAAGLGDSQNPAGQLNVVRRMNVELAERLRQLDGVHLLDVDHVFTQLGLRASQDARGARVSDAPLSLQALRALADVEVRHIRALRGPAAKCLIVDCDNTLWGGVVGEDGVAGLVLGERGEGRRYRDLQQSILDLRRRGVVLALCSKNEPADVLAVLSDHPDCLLSESDFATIRVNWQDKVDNIHSIADELNLGHEHLVFMDDNPVECEWVQNCLPEVTVIQWPGDLAAGRSLDDLGLFDNLALTDEDRARTDLYRAEAKRRAARDQMASVDDYMRSLEMVATVGRTRPQHLPRVGQLIQKTNQFNLTTRRHDLAALETLLVDSNAAVIWLNLGDRFGANGLVGCGIVRRQGEEAVVDSLLLSCRVIGRGAEAVLLHTLARIARRMGARTLVGEYIPSRRNGQVAGFYADQGFAGPERNGQGELWRWDLSKGLPAHPDWIQVVNEDVFDDG